MRYADVSFNERKIIIIGAQRSGTNIAAAVIAHDTGLPVYSERDFGYSSCVIGDKPDNDLIQFIHSESKYILQAPALNSYCHLIDTDALFVWVNRDVNHIRKSRKRANWPGEQIESAKYRKYFPEITFKDTVEAAVKAWQYQKSLVRHIELDYDSFSESPLWLEERSSLGIGETQRAGLP